MIRHDNENGSVCVSTNVYTDIAGTAASNCFGVKGMAARNMKDGVYHLLRKESMGKGVKATVTASARNGIFFIPAILLLPYFFGLTGVELAQTVADVCAFALSVPLAVSELKRMRT